MNTGTRPSKDTGDSSLQRQKFGERHRSEQSTLMDLRFPFPLPYSRLIKLTSGMIYETHSPWGVHRERLTLDTDGEDGENRKWGPLNRSCIFLFVLITISCDDFCDG